MTRRAPCSEAPRRAGAARRPRRGDALIESLIAGVIGAALLLGTSFAISRVLGDKRYSVTQAMAVTQMRDLLATQSNLSTLCTAGTNLSMVMPAGGGTSTVPVTATCTFATVTVSLTSNTTISAATPAPVLTGMTLATAAANTTAKNLFGGDGVVAVSQ